MTLRRVSGGSWDAVFATHLSALLLQQSENPLRTACWFPLGLVLTRCETCPSNDLAEKWDSLHLPQMLFN